MNFASFLSGGFMSNIVVNPPEKKLAKRTSEYHTGSIITLIINGSREPTNVFQKKC